MLVDTPKCINCNEIGHVIVKSEEWRVWMGFDRPMMGSDRPMIQDVFRDYTPEIREQILTGIHPECWDEMFGEVPI